MDLFKRESAEDRERRISEESLEVIKTKWLVYKALMADPHATYSIGDKKLYTSVRKRLKGMFHGDMDKIERFKYIRDD